MEEQMPTSGIWFVKHREAGASYSSIMKLSELPKKWPLLHYFEYKDDILSKLVTYIDTCPNKAISLDEIVKFTLTQVAAEYVKDRDIEFPNKKIKNIEDLIDHLKN